MYMIFRKLSTVMHNQKKNNANLKLVAAQILTLKDSLVLESTSDNTINYPSEEFTEASYEDGTTQGDDDKEGDDEFIGDHMVGDQDDDEEGDIARVELEGSEYAEGDDYLPLFLLVVLVLGHNCHIFVFLTR